MRRLVSVLLLVAAVWLNISNAHVRAGDMVEILGQGSTFDDVYNRANAIKEDATALGFSSAGYPGQTNFDERNVSFMFQTDDDGVQLVAFSDDGVSVTITDLETGDTSTPLSNYSQGQALPNLSQSLRLVPFSFVPGRAYVVETHYLNTLYTGDGDIDGLKFFAFAGDAVAAAMPKLIANPQWYINNTNSGPIDGSKVFPGQEVVFQLSVIEADSLVDGAGQLIKDQRTGQPLRVPFSGSTTAKLVVENATFSGGGTTLDVTMRGTYDLRFDSVARIRIPADWDGTQKVKISYTIEDPGIIPPAQRRAADPASDVKDTTLTGTWSWSLGNVNGVPTTATGKAQKHITWPNGPLVNSALYSKQQTRQIVILYAYGPDLNGAGNPAGNYTGLTITESFGPVSTNLDQTRLDWILDKYRPATGTVDDAFNALLTTNGNLMSATFTIGPLGPESDATQDGYGLRYPEICLVDFLKPVNQNKSVTVTMQQDYSCPPTVKLTGDMPRSLKSSVDGVGAGTPPVPNNPTQQITSP